MNPINIDQNRTEIVKLLNSVGKDGTQQLVNWLNTSDFFVAPSSTKYHLAVEGGLAQHSLNTMRRLKRMCEEDAPEYDEGSIVVSGLLHDLCKIGAYKKAMLSVKNAETNKWEQKEGYEYTNALPLGHGEKSLYLASKFIKLSDEEALAIRWHMGAFDKSFQGGEKAMNDAWKQSKLALMLHLADMQASYLDEY